MAQIHNLAFLAQLRSDASNYVIRYRKGKVQQSGRGLVFWFRTETASIAEIPMDDRETTMFVTGRSQDFQQVAVQGMLTWHVVDPELLAQRVDFSIGLFSGKLQGDPIERIETRLAGLVNQAALQYLAEAPVRTLLDVGIEPLRQRLEVALAAANSLTDIGIAVVAVRVTSLAPSSELERALQTPTFEALQQKADEAMFERRALAVEKERAIAENELATKTELAPRKDTDQRRSRKRSQSGHRFGGCAANRSRRGSGPDPRHRCRKGGRRWRTHRHLSRSSTGGANGARRARTS